MPELRSFRKELMQGVVDLDKLKVVLNDIYGDPEQVTMETKPVIQMLVHACDYLSSNVTILKDRLKI